MSAARYEAAPRLRAADDVAVAADRASTESSGRALSDSVRASSSLYRSWFLLKVGWYASRTMKVWRRRNSAFWGSACRHLRRDRPLKKVLITSTIPQEGKSMVSANLACTLARRTQQRTLLMEGDVRRPSLSQMFGLGRIPGICECLQGERDLMSSIYHLEGPGLWFLPAGSAPKNPLELLQSGRLSAMMDQLTAWFDWIIIDSPPVMPLADTSVWMRLADGILLVVRQGITEKRQLAERTRSARAQKADWCRY